jgi:DNA-binding beta-propeller fold protein YncE
MNQISKILLIVFLVAAGAWYQAKSKSERGSSNYHFVKKTSLGGEGRWDYLTVDSEARRIYVSRSTHVMVVDEDTHQVIGDIPATPGVHGITLARNLGKGFTTNGKANSVTVFDLARLKTLSTINVTGENPDSSLYDEAHKRLWVFNGKTQNATVIDAQAGKVLETVPFPGTPEEGVLDDKGSLFVNIEDKNSIVEIDVATMKVKHTFALEGCDGPTGIAMDTSGRRIFSGCSGNKKLAVTNADTGKVVALLDICDGTDSTRFDKANRLIFSSCNEGSLSLNHQVSPDKYASTVNIKTEKGARTMALDTATHHVFLVTADYGPKPTPTPENPRGWPPLIPGSFRLLEYAP